MQGKIYQNKNCDNKNMKMFYNLFALKNYQKKYNKIIKL